MYGILVHHISLTYSRIHIYWGYIYHQYSNWQYVYGIPLHQITFPYTRMHIYWRYIYPSLQLTISLWNTITQIKFQMLENALILRIHLPLKLQLAICLWNIITPNKFHLSENVHILRIHPPPTTIDNRSME